MAGRDDPFLQHPTFPGTFSSYLRTYWTDSKSVFPHSKANKMSYIYIGKPNDVTSKNVKTEWLRTPVFLPVFPLNLGYDAMFCKNIIIIIIIKWKLMKLSTFRSNSWPCSRLIRPQKLKIVRNKSTPAFHIFARNFVRLANIEKGLYAAIGNSISFRTERTDFESIL